ncbi:hypothetical protein BC835DRAFT_1305273 [Cytidiella melzeri]|nr:hypothetical protein BC835DRAFT_1305273 [Cytidiella melzeri]
MTAVQVDTSMKYIVDDPGVKVDAAQTRIVKIQNAASGLWACNGAAVPRQGTPLDVYPIVLEPDNLQYDKYEVWKLILVRNVDKPWLGSGPRQLVGDWSRRYQGTLYSMAMNIIVVHLLLWLRYSMRDIVRVMQSAQENEIETE